MQVDNNLNYSHPAFGAIKYAGAVDTLKNVLSLKELNEFKELVKGCKMHEGADVILFGKDKKLSANIADSDKLRFGKVSHHSPMIFESHMHFIKRMVNKMINRSYQVERLIEKQNFKFED